MVKVNAPLGHHSTASSQSSCRERLFSGLPKRQKATGKTKLHCCFHRVVLSCRWLHNLAFAFLALPTVRFILYDLQIGLNLALFQPGLLRRYTAVIQFCFFIVYCTPAIALPSRTVFYTWSFSRRGNRMVLCFE